MARNLTLFAALVALGAVPASAAVTVVGSSAARLCYEAADSPRSPTTADIDRCNQAFEEDALSFTDRVATYVNRGIVRLRRNNVEGAIDDFDAAIALNPRQPEAFVNKGAALIRLEDAAGALPLFSVALEHGTRRPALAHYGRAIANEELGNVRAAFQDYQRAVELEPEWDEPRTELSRFRVVSR